MIQKGNYEKSNQHKSDGSVLKTIMTNYKDLEFLAEIRIGTHKQKFNITFDTCSSSLWVFSDLTSPNLKHNKFSCKASDTCSFVKRLVDISYGNREITGSSTKDTVYAFGTEMSEFKFLSAHEVGSTQIFFLFFRCS